MVSQYASDHHPHPLFLSNNAEEKNAAPGIVFARGGVMVSGGEPL